MAGAPDVVAVVSEREPPPSLLDRLGEIPIVSEVIHGGPRGDHADVVAPGCVVAVTDGSVDPIHSAAERYSDAPVVASLADQADVTPEDAFDAGASDVVRGGEGGQTLLSRRVADAIDRRRLDRRLEAVLSDPTAVVCILDADGTVEQANEAASAAAEGDVHGRNFWELPWCRRAMREEAVFEAAVEHALSGEFVRLETVMARGNVLDAEVILTPIGPPDGVGANESETAASGVIAKVRGVTDVGLDIGERPLLRTVVENVPLVLFAFDGDGEFLLSEGRGLDAIGLEPGEVVGDSVFDVYADTEAVLEQCRRALAGERIDEVVEIGDVAFEAWYHPVTEDGEVTKVIGAALDVTDLEEQKRELARQNERLEEFASIVSHDLRNPLNVARGEIERVATDPEEADVDRVRDALDRMEAIVSDVLTLARTGDAVDSPDPVSVGAVVRSAWGTVESKGATLTVEDDAIIRADPGRLQRLLENLLANAVTHGGEDVSVTVGTHEDGFYVADDGQGIPEEDREKVFESGFSTDRRGTGFGLSIVSEIAEAHGWEVSVGESASGGTRFDFDGVTFADG